MKLNEFLDGYTRLIEMIEEDMREVSMVMDKVFMDQMGLRFDISRHFNDHMVPRKVVDNNVRTKKTMPREDDVTKRELYGTFKKLIEKYKKNILNQRQFGKEFVAVVRNSENDVNIVFKIAYQYKNDKNPLLKVITIRRRKNFKTRPSDTVFDV